MRMEDYFISEFDLLCSCFAIASKVAIPRMLFMSVSRLCQGAQTTRTSDPVVFGARSRA
jgi:hypothetical protein